MITANGGYRLIQGLIPVEMYKELTETSRRLEQPRSESLRVAINAFLKNTKLKPEHNED